MRRERIALVSKLLIKAFQHACVRRVPSTLPRRRLPMGNWITNCMDIFWQTEMGNEDQHSFVWAFLPNCPLRCVNTFCTEVQHPETHVSWLERQRVCFCHDSYRCWSKRQPSGNSCFVLEANYNCESGICTMLCRTYRKSWLLFWLPRETKCWFANLCFRNKS